MDRQRYLPRERTQHTPRIYPRSLLASLLFVALVAASVLPSHARAAEPTDDPNAAWAPPASEAASAAVMIGVQPGTPEEAVVALVQGQGLLLQSYWPEPGIAVAQPDPAGGTLRAASAADTADTMAVLAASPLVRYAEPDGLVWAADTDAPAVEPPLEEPQPNDPLLDQQWALETVRAIDAWNITVGDPRVIIAVIDSGYESSHPDFDLEHIWTNVAEQNGEPGEDDDGNELVDDIHGWDWVDFDSQPNDLYGHGTHVLGSIAAVTNNHIGITGLGRNVTVLPLRILNHRGSGFITDLVSAMMYALDAGATIINLSLTIGENNTALRDAVEFAVSQGANVVAASGNSSSTVLWPAAYPDAVAVAATDVSDERASFSNFGEGVDIAAPGVSVLSTCYEYGVNGSCHDVYWELSGTSMATPHVSALAGLLWSLRPDLTNAEVIAQIEDAAVDVNSVNFPGKDDYLGAGRVDYYATLLAASADLVLLPELPATDTLLPGQTVNFSVSVRTPATAAKASAAATSTADVGAGVPVSGAVVYATILPGTAPAARAVTDETGTATLAVTTPATAGNYILRIQVGQAVENWAFTNAATPASIDVTLAQSETVAGITPSIPFTVEVRNDEGELEVDDMPLLLNTSRGTFEGGATQMPAVAVEGVYTGALLPGTDAGVAAITATAGLRSNVAKITIHPAPPADLKTDPSPRPIALTDTTGQVNLAFQVVDAFNNPVTNGVVIDLVTSIGELSAASLPTVNGRADTTLTFPLSATQAVTVVATVATPPITKTITVDPLAERVWLPTFQRR